MNTIQALAILSAPGACTRKEETKAPSPPGLPNPAVTIQLKGLAPWCGASVERALGKIPGVDRATLRKAGKLYYIDVVMQSGWRPTNSDIDKALARANKEMGDQVGTKYERAK